MPATTPQDIEDFLGQRRLAVIGVSRTPSDFSRLLLRELLHRGYDVVPVHPSADEIVGRNCFGRVQDVFPPVTAALLLTAPDVTEQVVRDCAEAGITHIWMHRGGGTGSVSQEAVAFCQKNGMQIVAGFCPHMFLPNTARFHRFHGWLLKLTGRYPK